MAVQARIQHLDHGGSVISTHTPVGGSLTWGYKANEPGDIAYQLPLSDPAIIRDGFAPYRTDWRLQIKFDNAAWKSITAGIHVPVNLVNDQDAVNVAGKDWAHWLEQPVWFQYYNYDWDTAGAATATRRRDVIKQSRAITAGIVENIAILAFTPGASQADMITKLISNTKRGTDYVNINPVFTGSAASSVLTLQAYIISFQDETTVLQHINNLAALDNPYGFDWTMNADKKMEFFGPRKTAAGSPTGIWYLQQDQLLEQPMTELDWTNNGPIGTHIVGLSIGSPALWHHKRDQDSVDKYREWLKIEHVGDRYIKSPDMKYAVDGIQDIFPHKDIKVTVLPELLVNQNIFGSDYLKQDGFENHIGDVVVVQWDFPPYHKVDAFYWITEQRYSGDPDGNWKCELGLQQIYG